jgi:pimeloyl-ACP methyl ester carboxylesterase
MTAVQANGITIEYETVGSADDEPMLLVMGFGAQLVYWPPRFLEQLAAAGYHVIVYDNRDVGLSTKFSLSGAADGGAGVAGALAGGGAAAYTVVDMAADGVGLLDALGIDRAHIVGASMGGFIVQSMAIDHPERVRSLCSIMSTTGDPSVPPPTPEAIAALTKVPASDREGYIEQSVETAHQIGATGFDIDDDWIRERSARSYDRCFHPEGRTLQALAVAASPDRTADLAGVTVPTVVIHGGADPLVSPVGGEMTAKAIPDAELLIVPGMGHDLPEGAWPAIVEAIVTNARKATS